MYIIHIDAEICEGCGDCVSTCPSELISLIEQNGTKVASYTGAVDDCLGCYSCESSCPNGALTITEN